jgi:hypothetical protein
VIAREKQRKLVGSGAITDGETDAKNASVDCPLRLYHKSARVDCEDID